MCASSLFLCAKFIIGPRNDRQKENLISLLAIAIVYFRSAVGLSSGRKVKEFEIFFTCDDKDIPNILFVYEKCEEKMKREDNLITHENKKARNDVL